MEREREQELLKAARKGDESAFLKLFDEHQVPLYRFAYRLTRSEADAQDIVQECFLGLLRRKGGFDPGRTAMRTYLFGAVRNQALKRLRSRQRDGGESPEAAAAPSPEDCAARSEVRDAVKIAVAGLPPEQQEVIILAHFEQWPLADIAELLAVEVGAVKMRLYRARAALKNALAVYAPASREEGL